MVKAQNLGLGTTNLIRALVLTGVAYMIFGSLMGSLAFLGAYVTWVLLGELVGLERRE